MPTSNVQLLSFRRLVSGVFKLVLVAFVATAVAQEPKRVNKSFFGDVAIDGYDPVAYFVDARATKGSAEFTHQWAGANWHFVSAANRDLFAAEPAKYAPQYGGFCTNSAAVGRDAPVDPNAWTIWQGKLYLSFSQQHSARFAQDPERFVRAADRNWK